jgi:arabinose-5-phosphate isomerase
MPDAMRVLSKKRLGCVCVVSGDGLLAGIVTDGDLARNLDRNLAQTTVDDIMTRRPKTVGPQVLASAALALINEHDVSALVVVDDQRPVGIVHFHDLLRLGVA